MKQGAKTKACIGGGVLLLAVSALMIIVGVFIVDYVDDQINDAVESGLQLTKSDEDNQRESWEDWVNTDVFFDYYVFNYTNVPEMLGAGEIPKVVETGPYTFQEYSTKYNISFETLDDGSEVVRYNQWWNKTHRDDLASEDPANAVNIMNPVYWGLSSNIYSLLKENFYNLFSANGAAPGFSKDQEFPRGILGPMFFPRNVTGSGLPLQDTLIHKTDSLVTTFAGGLSMGGLPAIFNKPSADLHKAIGYQAGYLRQAAEELSAAGGVPSPLSPADAEYATFIGAAVTAHLFGSAAVGALEPVAANFTALTLCEDPASCPATATLLGMVGGNATIATGVYANLFINPNATLFPNATGLMNPQSNYWAVPALANNATIKAGLTAQYATLYQPYLGGAVGAAVTLEQTATIVGAIVDWVQREFIVYPVEPVVNDEKTAVQLVEVPQWSNVTEARSVLGVERLLTDNLVLGGNDEATATATVGALVGAADPSDKLDSYAKFGAAQLASYGMLQGPVLPRRAGGLTSIPVGGDTYYGPEFEAFRRNRDPSVTAIKRDQMLRWMDGGATSLTQSSIWGAFMLDKFLGAGGHFIQNALQQANAAYTTEAIYGLDKHPAAGGPANSNYEVVMEYLTMYAPFHLFLGTLLLDQNFGPWFKVTPKQLLLGSEAPLELRLALEGGGLTLNPNNPGLITSYEDEEDHYSQTKQGRYGMFSGTKGRLANVRQFSHYRDSAAFSTMRQASGSSESQNANKSDVSTCVYSELSTQALPSDLYADTAEENVTITPENITCAFWRSEEVIGLNVAASNGNNFAPFKEDVDPKDNPLYVFIAEGQRVIRADYQEDVEVKGIKLHRYVADTEVTARADGPDHQNYKYRMENTPSGIVPMDLIARGLPAAVSRPHFYDGDVARLRSRIEGLDGDEAKHTTYIDVEPLTGATMQGAKRFMNNLRCDKAKQDLPYFQNMWNYITLDSALRVEGEYNTYMYLPWYWGTERGVIDDEDAGDFRSGVYDNRDLSETLSIVFLVVGIALAATSSICLIYYCRQKGEASGMPTRLESKTNL